MKFLDLFAGIGGFRLGLEAAGHECIGFCEIDRFARTSYKAIHDTKGEIELHDITTVSDESIRGFGSVDIICGGFPCQAFSIAGNRRGFDDTRGTLFFEIARFASILRPSYLFLENVKGLLSHNGGATFETIIRTLDELGYNVEWQVLNSKDFGVPQNRERVFIVGHLRGRSTRNIFPLRQESTEFIGESTVIKVVGNTKNPESSTLGTKTEVYDPTGISGALLATDYKDPKQIIVKSLGNVNPSGRTMQGGNNEPKIIQRSRGQNKGGYHAIAPTVTSNSYQENNYVKVYDLYNKTTNTIVGTLTANGHIGNTKRGTFAVQHGYRIRKLTPKECWRLQGFPDWAFDKAQAVNSNSQLYKQAGNSVTVNVIYAIARNMEIINDRSH